MGTLKMPHRTRLTEMVMNWLNNQLPAPKLDNSDLMPYLPTFVQRHLQTIQQKQESIDAVRKWNQ